MEAKTGEFPGKRETTFDELLKEFGDYKKRLESEGKPIDNRRCWINFLMSREDDGSLIFARSVEDSLSYEERNIISLLEGGKVEEAREVASLTKLMRERLSQMYKRVDILDSQGKAVGYKLVRQVSPPAYLPSTEEL